MAIYRCNACGYVSEEAQTAIGQKIPCGRCGQPSTVYGTVFFVEKLIERYAAAMRELQALRASADGASASEAAAPDQQAALAGMSGDLSALNLATAEQHLSLHAWFAARQIEPTFDYSAVDTSGFFDDAARMLAERLDLFAELIERVAYAYRKNHTGVNLDLSRLPQKDAQAINRLCRELYGHTFFSRYHYQKPEKVVRLSLQPAPAVRRFFEGGWLEWCALLETLQALQAARRPDFSCARGVKLTFNNQDVHELDVVVLPAGRPPICIECKSGEFRRDIDKLLRLRKRLGLERQHFIICVADLSNEQAAGLSSMYELSFVNLSQLRPHIQSLL